MYTREPKAQSDSKGLAEQFFNAALLTTNPVTRGEVVSPHTSSGMPYTRGQLLLICSIFEGGLHMRAVVHTDVPKREREELKESIMYDRRSALQRTAWA